MQTYRWCYRTLGVSSNSSWDEVRLAYRRRLRACHPDLAGIGETELEGIASREETFRNTVQAYRTLASYYKQNGRLPTIYLPVTPFRKDDAFRDTWRGPSAGKRARQRVSIPRFHRIAVGGFLLSVAVVAAANLIESNRNAVVENRPGSRAQLQVGMEPTQVVDLHGVPTLTRGSVWFYGQSGVIFDKGCVVGWEDSEPFPLQTFVAVRSPEKRNPEVFADPLLDPPRNTNPCLPQRERQQFDES